MSYDDLGWPLGSQAGKRAGKLVIDFRKAKSSDRREFEGVGQIGRDFATMESDIGDYDFRYSPYLKYSRDELLVPCLVKF